MKKSGSNKICLLRDHSIKNFNHYNKIFDEILPLTDPDSNFYQTVMYSILNVCD